MEHNEQILIVDYGSQYTQLIARRIREQKVYCTIIPAQRLSSVLLQETKPKGIILSGGPASVYQQGAPLPDAHIFEHGIPTLGICYGMQSMVYSLGGKVERAASREYGRSMVKVIESEGLFSDVKSSFNSWMSHGDSVKTLPEGFYAVAESDNTAFAAIAHKKHKLYGLQFHPEVRHTEDDDQILKNFIFAICGCEGSWTMQSFVDATVQEIRAKVGSERVILGLSGGVDSSVAAVLLHEALGDQLTCVFVDNGLLRAGEREQVEQTFRDHFHIDLRVVDAEDRFLEKLAGVTDPERKRKIIGNEFVRVFEEAALSIKDAAFLAQGTLYPDVIESVSAWGGPSATIKTHHNVGGLPEDMKFKLVEPLRDLFKDEVREVGKLLGLPDAMVHRHPFPGPGLAVRILGEVTRDGLRKLREADVRFIEELHKAGWYYKVWQAFAVLLPIRTVGVMGDERTYDQAIAIRSVDSHDAMTADWSPLPYALLAKVSNRIINEVEGINRVVYDISSKPPATIEWE